MIGNFLIKTRIINQNFRVFWGRTFLQAILRAPSVSVQVSSYLMLHNKPFQNVVVCNNNIYCAYESGLGAVLIRDIWSLLSLASSRAAQGLGAATSRAPQTPVYLCAISPCNLSNLAASGKPENLRVGSGLPKHVN